MSSGNNIPDAAQLAALGQTPAEYNANSQGVNFIGTYQSPNVPLWASAIGNMTTGPDILVSTIGMNSGYNPGTGGFMRMDISGVGNLNYNPRSTISGKIIMKRTQDTYLGSGAVLSMNNACIASTMSNTEYYQIPAMRFELGTYYDDLGLGTLYLYGLNRLTDPPIATFTSGSNAALNIIAPNGVLINGQPAGVLANPMVSSLTINYANSLPGGSVGALILKSPYGVSPPSAFNQQAYIMFDNYSGSFADPVTIDTQGIVNNIGQSNINTLYLSGSAFAGGAVAMKQMMITNGSVNPNTGQNAGYIYSINNSNNSSIGIAIQTQDCYVSSLRISTINGVAPGSYVPPENFTASSIGVQTFSAYTASISSITDLSTINGLPPGVATLPADAVLSTLTMNQAPGSQIYLQGSTINVVPSISSMKGATLLFDYALNANNVICVKALANVDTQLGSASFVNGLAVCDYNTSSSNYTDFVPMACGGVTFGTFLADYNSPSGRKYGSIQPTGTGSNTGLLINAPNLTIQAPTTMGSIVATSLSVSTISVSSIVDYIFTTSSFNASTITTTTNQTNLLTTSTMNFNASAGGVNLGGIDLGMGGFLGGLTGQLVSGALTTTISGLALGTGIAGLILPRTGGNPPPGGNVSSFTTINGTTQLQFSTIGANTSTFYRFTGGSDPTLTPSVEVFTSSIVTPGTVCLRSFSDPINPANPSSFTSTLQSFGQWVPVPAIPGSVPTNIVASTITLGNVGNTITTNGSASINGVNIGSTFGAVVATSLTAGSGVSLASMTAGGAITGTSIGLTGAKTISCGGITCTTIVGSGNGSLGGCTFGAPSGQFVATTVNATNVNATNVNATGFISTIGVINVTGSGYINNTGLIGSAILQYGVLNVSPALPNATMILNSGNTRTATLTVDQSTITNTLNVNYINGGFCAPPGAPYNFSQFSSCPTNYLQSPFTVGVTYPVNGFTITSPVCVRFMAATNYFDRNSLVIAEPMCGLWEINSTFTYTTAGGVKLKCYITPISVHNITLAVVSNPATSLTFTITNTGQNMSYLNLSWFAAPWTTGGN